MTKQKARLGDILVKAGLISESRLHDALEIQKTDRKPLGKILVNMGVATLDDINWALSSQLDIPYINVHSGMVDRDLIKLFPLKFITERNILPIIRVGNELTIATADPTDLNTIAEMEAASKSKIKVCIADQNAIINALKEIVPNECLSSEIRSGKDRSVGRNSLHSSGTGGFLEECLRYLLDTNLTEFRIDAAAEGIHTRVRDGKRLKSVNIESKSSIERVISSILSLSGASFEDRYNSSLKFSLPVDTSRALLRADIFQTVFGDNITLRLIAIENSIRSVNELGMSPQQLYRYKEFLNTLKGVVIISGERDTVKSLLYSSITEIIPENYAIFSIETGSGTCLENIYQITVDTELNLASTIGKVSRYNPDVVAVDNLDGAASLDNLLELSGDRLLLAGISEMSVEEIFEILKSSKCEKAIFEKMPLSIIRIKTVEMTCKYCRNGSNAPGKGCEKCRYTGLAGVTYQYDTVFINEGFEPLLNIDIPSLIDKKRRVGDYLSADINKTFDHFPDEVSKQDVKGGQ